MRAEQALDGLDVLLLREAGEVVEIGQGLVEHPGGGAARMSARAVASNSLSRMLPLPTRLKRQAFSVRHPLLCMGARCGRRGSRWVSSDLGRGWRDAGLLGLVDVLAVGAALGDEGVEDQRGLGQGESVDGLELAEVESGGGFFVTWGRGLGTRRVWMRHADGGRLRTAACDGGVSRRAAVVVLVLVVGAQAVGMSSSTWPMDSRWFFGRAASEPR